MRYLGGKSRIAKQLVNFMSLEREPSMTWVEPFVGSAKVISLVKGHRIGADINHEMIALLKAIQGGWKPPKSVSKEFYNEVKNNQDKYTDHLKGFISIGCSFKAMRWSAYAENGPTRPKNMLGDNYALQSHNALMKLKPLLENIDFVSCDYKSLTIPPKSLIYCDPPYKNTVGYGFKFNHDLFYQWCRDKVDEGHLVFVSEYDLPNEFELVWSKKVNNLVSKNNSKTSIEKLYRLHKKPKFKLITY